MVEIKSQSSSREMLKLPKNIRQIGLPEEKKKIYVEDYVVTYMNQLASEQPNQQSAAILLGFCTKQKDVRLTFIHGAIGIPSAKVEDDHIIFGSDMWEDIYETIKKYFHDSEIVGWFLTRPGKSLGINEKITKIHVDQFPGREKTLFLMDPLDKEEAFFIYEGGRLTRQQGYYVYYERNEDMQNYMVEQRKDKGSEDTLEAAHLKKQVYAEREKRTESSKAKKNSSRKWMGTILAAMFLVVIGMNVMDHFYGQQSTIAQNDWIDEEPLTIQIPEDTAMAVFETIEWNNETDEADETNESSDESDDEDVHVHASTVMRYKVQKGDTLVNISIGLYDTMDYVDLICEMNDISDPDLIYEGMVLELP